MRKFVLIVLVVGAYLIYTNRLRLFVRDPLASVTRGDTTEVGAQVFLNYNNDVLLESDHAPMYLTIVQHDQPIGVPDGLKCIHYLVCLAGGFPAPLAAPTPGARIAAMSPKLVQFRDGDGSDVAVKLH